MKRAIFIGRFQPIHDGHMFVIETSLQKYDDELFIIMGSAQHAYTEKNPFTAGERYEMIELALKDYGLPRVPIVPVDDLGVYTLWPSKVISMVPPFDVVVTGSDIISTLFQQHRYEIDKWFRPPLPSSTAIRNFIYQNRSTWEQMVPPSVVEYMKKNGLVERVRRLGE